VRLVLGCSGAAVAVIAVALRARFVAGATMASGARRAASPSASALDPSRPPPGAGATGNIAGAAQ
jgi:hypothetical protein